MKKVDINRRLIGWVFVVCGVVSFGFWVKGRGGMNVKGASDWWGPLKITYNIEPKKLVVERDTSRPTTMFETQVAQKINDLTGKYSVYVYRLRDRVGYGVNEDEAMPAASIMKVPIMTAVYRSVEAGRLALDSIYTLRDEDKQSGSGPLEFMDAGTSLTVRDLLQYMGKNSDNTAPAVLVGMIGTDKVRETIKVLGMERTSFDDNITTAYDLAMMWKRLYDGGVVTEEHKQEMWGFLQDSIYEERLPAGLPENLQVVHKVGTGDGVWADGGIVQCPVSNVRCSVQPEVVMVLNKGINADEANKTVPNIVKMIWEYENSIVANQEAKQNESSTQSGKKAN